MKTLMIAAGALALTAGMAQAQPTQMRSTAYETAPSAVETAPAGYYSPSAGTNYPAVGESPASGFGYQNSDDAMSSSTNRGAGVSRSSAANNG